MLALPAFGVVAAVGGDERADPRPKFEEIEGGPTLLTPEESLRADATVLAEVENISVAEAVDRLEFQVETTAWLNELDARSALGDGFAGSRVSLEDRELFVYFKGKAPIEAAALERGSVRVVDGQRFSLADLELIHQELADVAHGLGFQQATAAVDIETQRFTMEVSEGDSGRKSLSMSASEVEEAVRATLSASIGVDLASGDVVVTVHSGAVLEANHSYGGANVADDGVFECTSGFAVEDSSSGADGVLTAGHCEGINQIADNGNGNYYTAPFMREYYWS